MADDDAAGPPADGRPTPADVGGQLVAQREAAGLTVDEIASRTRIRGSLIRAMESGDFAPCGGAVYARGHLRSIAHVTGGDDKALVAAYDRMAGQPSPSATRVAIEPTEDAPPAVPFAGLATTTTPAPTPVQVTGRAERPEPMRPSRSGGPTIVLPGGSTVRERRGSPWLIAAVGAAALVVLVLAIALVRPHHTAHPLTGATHSASTSPTPAATTTPVVTTPTAPQTLADAGVNVVVTIGTSASWVHAVDATGTVVFQGVLQPGTTKTFHSAQQLTFIFGYAPAVHLVVNGHDIGTPPANGGSDIADAVFDSTSGA
jgi:cytoskeletal protein RodZ